MSPQYADPAERLYKTTTFAVMISFMGHHLAYFDREDRGSPKVGSLVSEHVLRAVHHIFTTGDNDDPTPEEVMKLAVQFRGKGGRVFFPDKPSGDARRRGLAW